MTRLRALIVDDDFAVARIHRGFVEAHPSYTVIGEVHTGASALESIELLSPDVVLLDVYLPDFSGLEVLSRLHAKRAHTPEIIAVTAARDLASVREARASGVRHYLVKPFTASALRERLDEIVGHRQTMLRSASVPLDQRTVDEILTAATTARRALPPKGLSVATLELVSATLASAGEDVSASQVADRIGMSRVAARRYLEHLVTSGQAVVEPRYGTTGRPEHRFRAVG